VVLIDTGPDFREQALRWAFGGRLRCSIRTLTQTTFWGWTICVAELCHVQKIGAIPLYVTAETRGTMERIFFLHVFG